MIASKMLMIANANEINTQTEIIEESSNARAFDDSSTTACTGCC
jgi:hypothetical protein